MAAWLLKAEPDSRIVNGKDVKYTIDDLQKEKTSQWEGIRNYEARNNLCKMKVGDKAFFYRSNCKEPAIVGVMKIIKEAYQDPTAFDADHPYFDPKKPDRWKTVDVEYVEHLSPVLLSDLKKNPKLAEMALLKRSRLSIVPVSEEEWDQVMAMAQQSDEPPPKKKKTKKAT